ncbi:MAG: NTP transferase domain-containing protein [Crenarchaeota archaeon]|nr:NTP transferase domain-containing protein [Thermoproteota archaeon]
MVKCVVIFAGGKGSRIGNPEKMLLKICNKPIILMLIDSLSKYFRRIIIVTSKFHKNLIELLKVHSKVDLIILPARDYCEDLCHIINIVRPRPLLMLPSDIVLRNVKRFFDIIRSVKSNVDIVTLSYIDGTPLGVSIVYSYRCVPGVELSWINLNVFTIDDVFDIDTLLDYEIAKRSIICE